MTGPELAEAHREMEEILTASAEHWRSRRSDYGDAFWELGARGQFSEIWRKIKKLQRAVWEGKELNGESPEQIAIEIIPHCLMMVYLIRKGRL